MPPKKETKYVSMGTYDGLSKNCNGTVRNNGRFDTVSNKAASRSVSRSRHGCQIIDRRIKKPMPELYSQDDMETLQTVAEICAIQDNLDRPD